jgi:hypothetical protein
LRHAHIVAELGGKGNTRKQEKEEDSPLEKARKYGRSRVKRQKEILSLGGLEKLSFKKRT